MQRRAETGADDTDSNRLSGIGLEYGSGQRLGVAHTTSRSWRDRGTARRWVGHVVLWGTDATTSAGGAPDLQRIGFISVLSAGYADSRRFFPTRRAAAACGRRRRRRPYNRPLLLRSGTS